MNELQEFLKLISEEKQQQQKEQKEFSEKIKNNAFLNLFNQKPVEVIYSTEPEPILENTQQKEQPISIITESQESEIKLIEKTDLLNPANYDKLFKTNTDHFNQPKNQKTPLEINALTKKVKYLEDWVTKISMTGPGSGEVNFRYLDDVDRNSIGNTDQILRYNPISKKFFFGQLSGDQGGINSLKFNLTGANTTPTPGTLDWNLGKDCLNVYQSDGTTLQVGLENYFRVVNGSGNTLFDGDIVGFSGVDSPDQETPIVTPFLANKDAKPHYIVGVMSNTLSANQVGRATTFGEVRNCNTTGNQVGETWNIGDLLYAHPTIPGKLTKHVPTAPNIVISVAAVMKVGANTGTLLVRPTITPRLYYGSFYDTTNQTAAQINTPYAIKLNSVDFSSGFTLGAGANTSQIIAQNHGLYNFQFSLQVTSTNSSTSYFWIWYRKNGQDVPYSATKLSVQSNGGFAAPAWNFITSMEPNDYFELVWATDSTNVSITAPAATAFCPATPSVIITVSQVNL